MTSSTSQQRRNKIPLQKRDQSYDQHVQSIRKAQPLLFGNVEFLSVIQASTLYQEQKAIEDAAKIASNSMSRRQRRVLFVDCRTHDERAVSMIPGAISKDDFMHNHNNVQHPPPENIVCYCTIGIRSGMAANEIQKVVEKNAKKHHGGKALKDASQFPCKVYNLEGGIIGLARAHFPLEDPNTKQPIQKLHTFNTHFDLAPDDYEVSHFGWFGGATERLRTWWQGMRIRTGV